MKKLTIEIEFDESWDAYIPDDEEKVKHILMPQLEGVKVKIVESPVITIIKIAEKATGISYDQMQKNTKKRDIVEARWYAMKLLYEAEVGGLSFVGDLFGVDHSTVIHGIKKINELIETKQFKV